MCITKLEKHNRRLTPFLFQCSRNSDCTFLCSNWRVFYYSGKAMFSGENIVPSIVFTTSNLLFPPNHLSLAARNPLVRKNITFDVFKINKISLPPLMFSKLTKSLCDYGQFIRLILEPNYSRSKYKSSANSRINSSTSVGPRDMPCLKCLSCNLVC